MAAEPKDGRGRDFACIVYPESTPENFLEIIDSWHVPAFLSPLHDEDVEIEFQTDDYDVVSWKKAHYHLMLMFPGKKSKDQVKELFKQVNGVGCIMLSNGVGMARYFCHLDNPDKHQYDRNDVRCFAGSDYILYISTSNDIIQIVQDMSVYIIQNKVMYLDDLFMYAVENDKREWIWIMISKHTLWVRSLCSSIRDKERDKKQERIEGKEDRKILLIDKSTGEVVDNLE